MQLVKTFLATPEQKFFLEACMLSTKFYYLHSKFIHGFTSSLKVIKTIKYSLYHAFIVDISLFVGGRSQINENVWKNSDGSKIENKKYPPGDELICQQMTWPLTYNDGVNLRSMKCNQKAYFICQTKCKFE